MFLTVSDTLLLSATTVRMLSINWRVTVASVSMIPVLCLFVCMMNKRIKRHQRAAMEKASDLQEIKVKFTKEKNAGDKFLPYKRDEKLSRPWAIPGTKGLEQKTLQEMYGTWFSLPRFAQMHIAGSPSMRSQA